MRNECIDLAKHCIGLGKRKPYMRHGRRYYKPYRNYFASAGIGKDYEKCEMLVAAGYAERSGTKNQHGGYTYFLTRAGLNWLGNEIGVLIYDEED